MSVLHYASRRLRAEAPKAGIGVALLGTGLAALVHSGHRQAAAQFGIALCGLLAFTGARSSGLLDRLDTKTTLLIFFVALALISRLLGTWRDQEQTLTQNKDKTE